MPHLKVVGRNSYLFEAFFASASFPCKMLHEQLWKVLSVTGEVSTTVNLERREHADVRLLITTHADNKHLFDGKATNKDAFEKIAEHFTKASGVLVKWRKGACKRMGLVTNGTLSSQTEVPNRNFPNFFVNGKRPLYPVVSYPWTFRTQAQTFRARFRSVRTQPSCRFVSNKLSCHLMFL